MKLISHLQDLVPPQRAEPFHRHWAVPAPVTCTLPMSVAAAMKTDGFAVISLPQTVTSQINVLLGQARQFFDSGAAKDDVGSLQHLDDAIRFYTGDGKNLFDEFQQESPGRQAIHLKRKGYLSERYFRNAEALHRLEDWEVLQRSRRELGTSLATIAQSLLLELESADGEAGADGTVDIELQGCTDNSRFSIYSTTSSADADDELSVPAHVDRGFLTLCYSESKGLEVQHPTSRQFWQTVGGRRGSLVVMAGHLLSTITQGSYPACRHRVRSHGPRLSLVFTLRPSRSALLYWPLPRLPRWSGQARSRSWHAGAVMDELQGSVSEAGLEFASQRTALVGEVLAQQERWVALMMGVHARLGARSKVARWGGLPTEVWKLVCVDALGVNIVVNVDDGSGCTQQMRAYSALKQVQVMRVLDPLFRAAKLPLSTFILFVEGEVLRRYGSMAEQCWSNGMSTSTEISARPYGPGEGYLNLRVKGQDGNIVHFKIRRQTRLRKLFEAYCARQSLQYDQIRFLFRWDRLSGDQTPDCLDMDNDDEIDAMLFQIGD